MQPQVSAAGEGDTPEDKVLELAADVLKKIPDLIDYELTAKIMADDPSPLNVVLLQEVFILLNDREGSDEGKELDGNFSERYENIKKTRCSNCIAIARNIHSNSSLSVPELHAP